MEAYKEIIDYVMNCKELREVCTFEPIRNALLVILDEGEYTSESIMQKLRLNPSEIISIKLISSLWARHRS